MMNPVKKDILTPSAYKHYPRVLQMMEALEADRHRLGAPFLKKKFRYLDGTYVLLHAMIGFNKIVMWGGGAVPHLNFTDYESGWAYDWYKDVISTASFASAYTGTDPLKPFFNGRSQVSDRAYMAYNGKWSSGQIEGGNSLTYLGGINAYEMTLLTDEGLNVYGRVGDTVGLVATLPQIIIPKWSVPYGGLFLFSTIGPESAWNLFKTNMGLTFNAATRTINDSWYWVPSFFVAQPADAFSLKPGVYYGKYPYSNYGIEDPLETATVVLKGVVSRRASVGDFQEGWAEYVTEINGTTKHDLHFYFENLSVPANPNFGYLRIAGTFADQYITIGWDGKGYDASMIITLDATWIDFDLDMWSCDVWNDDSALIPTNNNAVGIVLSEGSRAKVYRYTGATTVLLETEQYHSHSVSHNGQYLAVFEGADGIITKATVWDLYGTREATLEGEGAYTMAAVTEIISSEAVAVGALTGCIIPHREEDYEPTELGYQLEVPTSTVPPSDYSDYMPSLAILSFGKRGITPVFKKITCDDGKTARYGISVDDCFDSTVIIEDPDGAGGVKDEKLVGWWDYGGVLKGVVRGNFTGQHPNMRFQGVGTGEEITLSDTFSIVQYEDGTLGFEGYSGELEIGNCIVLETDGYRIDPLCSECGEDFTATAGSSCGQTAERDYEVEPLTPMYITGNETFSGTFSSYNGYGKITWDSSQGEIDPDTGTVISAAGTCGTVTVTATDECGRSASLEVRGNTGTWYQVWSWAGDGSYTTGGDGCCGDADPNKPDWCGFCDISSCYCGSGYVYTSAVSRWHNCAYPGWAGPREACSGEFTTCIVYRYEFRCTDPGACSAGS